MSYTVNKADQIALREMLESIQFTGDAERRKNLPDVSDPEDDEPSAKVRRVRTPARRSLGTAPSRSTSATPTPPSPTFPNPRTCHLLDAGQTRCRRSR